MTSHRWPLWPLATALGFIAAAAALQFTQIFRACAANVPQVGDQTEDGTLRGLGSTECVYETQGGEGVSFLIDTVPLAIVLIVSVTALLCLVVAKFRDRA